VDGNTGGSRQEPAIANRALLDILRSDIGLSE
jgi:hypothetical protein